MSWPVVPLGEVAETALGKMLDRGRPRGHAHVPYLRNVNVQWGRIDTDDLLTMEIADDERERFSVREGDLLVCEGGEIGRCAIWRGREDYIAYQKALHRIRPSDSLDARFLRYLLEHHSLSGTLAGFSTGTTIAHLPQQQLRRVPVPLPPVEEQRRIVDLLEDHLSRLDAADGYLNANRIRLDAMATASLSNLRRSLGGAPSRRISEVADTALGKMLDAARQTGTPTPYLRNINVRWGSFDLTDLQATLLTARDVERFDVLPGDVFACEGGEPGRCAVWRGQQTGLAYQKALHRLRVRNPDEMNPDFLALMLTEAIRSGRHDHLYTGTTIKHLPQEKLRQIEIPVPDTAIQQRAVAEAARLTESKERLARTHDAASARAAALRRSLLAAAFSGRLTHAREVDRV